MFSRVGIADGEEDGGNDLLRQVVNHSRRWILRFGGQHSGSRDRSGAQASRNRTGLDRIAEQNRSHIDGGG